MRSGPCGRRKRRPAAPSYPGAPDREVECPEAAVSGGASGVSGGSRWSGAASPVSAFVASHLDPGKAPFVKTPPGALPCPYVDDTGEPVTGGTRVRAGIVPAAAWPGRAIATDSVEALL